MIRFGVYTGASKSQDKTTTTNNNNTNTDTRHDTISQANTKTRQAKKRPGQTTRHGKIRVPD
jgi:hypothetical protein